MFGGQYLTFSGPCVDLYTSFKVKFHNIRYELRCEMDSPYSFYCITPMFDSTGDVQVDIILANQNKTDMFIGNYTVLNPAFSKVLVNRHNGSSWENGEHIISWNGNVKELQNSSTVDIYVFSIKEENDEIKLNPFIAKTNILNSIGWTTFSLKMTEQVAILRVTSRVQTAYIMPQRGIWSDLFPVTPSRTNAILFCKNWIKKEVWYPKLSLAEPCPCTLQQALLDIVKYQPDPDCNMLHMGAEGRGNCRYRRDAQHCVRLTIPSEDGTDNVCCFNEYGILIDSRSHEGGTQQRFHYRGDDQWNIPYVTNFYKDVVPFLHCCRFSQMSSNETSDEKETYSLCQDFLALRRYSSCENYDPPRPARTSGDPHITTLDGLSYTFNGAGEFVYIYTEDDLFKSQIRFEQFRKDDGSLVKATVATALAMEYTNISDCIEIRLNSIRTADVLRNGELLDFQDSRWINVKGATIILLPTKGNNTNRSFMIMFQEIKIAFSIEASKDVLNVMPVVQGKDLNGTLKGLLGNYDGSPSNDLLFSTRQQLLLNETDDSLIFEFGMSWAINESESLFTYEPGKSFADYRQPSFRPVFESSVSVTEEVRAVCGEDKDCIFDFSVTGSRDVAEQSLTFQKQFQESQQAAVIVLTCYDLPTIPGGVWETTNGNLKNSKFLWSFYRNGNLIDSRSHEGGTQQRYHYRGDNHNNMPYVTNFCKDVVPFLHCCRFSQTSLNETSDEDETHSLCQEFLTLRKYSSCENYHPPKPAKTNGDPHITTLDGLSYTFNGAGEFVYIYTEDDLFKSQIRFQQFRKDDGSLVMATVATALVMEYENRSDCIEIRLNSIRTTDVLRNGELLDFQDSRWINAKGVTIVSLPTKGNNTGRSFMIMFQEIKMAFSIEASKDILNVMPVVQGKELNGTLKGLLGNNDGSPLNDLFFSTHQQLQQNKTDDSLNFEFGMSWAIHETESLFTYEPGKSFADYHQPSFWPVFESSVSVTEEVRAMCGEDKDCIFDFSVTGSRDVAEQSRIFQKQFQESQQAAVIVLTCEDLPTIPGGVWETTNGNLENSSAVFVCRDGYMISDNINNVTCLNGRWEQFESVSCRLNSLQTTQTKAGVLQISQSAKLPAYIGVGVGLFLLAAFIMVFILYQRKKARRGHWKVFSSEKSLTFPKTSDSEENSAALTQLPMEQNTEKC